MKLQIKRVIFLVAVNPSSKIKKLLEHNENTMINALI